jgi:hypothetical protein
MGQPVFYISALGFKILIGGSMLLLGIMGSFIIYMLIKEIRNKSVW